MKSPSIFGTFSFSAKTLLRHRSILVPFAIFFGLELLILLLVFLAPQPPFNALFGPIIRTIWGERFLHYPDHFLLFPTLDFKIKLMLSLVYGPLMGAWAALLVGRAFHGQKPDPAAALPDALKKYGFAFTVIVCVNLCAFLIHKGMKIGLSAYFNSGNETLLHLSESTWGGTLATAIDVFIVILLQTMFVYSIPMIALQRAKPFEALGRSVAFGRRHTLQTILLAALPQTFVLPSLLLLYRAPQIAQRLFPETIMLACVAGAVVSTLIVDVIITVTTTHFLLAAADKDMP